MSRDQGSANEPAYPLRGDEVALALVEPERVVQRGDRLVGARAELERLSEVDERSRVGVEIVALGGALDGATCERLGLGGVAPERRLPRSGAEEADLRIAVVVEDPA